MLGLIAVNIFIMKRQMIPFKKKMAAAGGNTIIILIN